MNMNPPSDLSFQYPYRIACGGTEIPMYNSNIGGWVIYVYNMQSGKHEWYSWRDDRFYTEAEFTAFQNK